MLICIFYTLALANFLIQINDDKLTKTSLGVANFVYLSLWNYKKSQSLLIFFINSLIMDNEKLHHLLLTLCIPQNFFDKITRSYNHVK